MIIVYGYCFSYSETYSHSTDPNGISGFNLIHDYFASKVEYLSSNIPFQLIPYNYYNSDRDGKYCLALKIYDRGKNLLNIPVESMYKDLSNNALLNQYYKFLKECLLQNCEQYIPKMMVLH